MTGFSVRHAGAFRWVWHAYLHGDVVGEGSCPLKLQAKWVATARLRRQVRRHGRNGSGRVTARSPRPSAMAAE